MSSKIQIQQEQTTKKMALPLIALLTANAISMIGNVLAIIALPWFVLQTTGSAIQTGITAFFTIIPTVIATFFGGAFVDRLGFKRMSVSADIICGIAIALIPLCFYSHLLQFWLLLALVFLGNLLDAPGSTAREALVPDLATQAGVTLERATSATQAIERGARLFGAPLAGLLITLVDANSVLLIDAVTFFASAVIVACCIPSTHAKSTEQSSKHYFSDLKQGFQFIRSDRLILAIFLTVMITNCFDAPVFGIIYPVYAKQFFGNAFDLGLLIAVGGGGAFVGAIIFGAINARLPRKALFIGGFIITSSRYLLLAFVHVPWIIVGSSFISGLAAGPINPVISTIVFERIPESIRGRVLGTLGGVAFVAMPLGALLGTFSVAHFGVVSTLIGLGACYLLFSLSMLFNPALSEMDKRQSVV